MLGKVLPMLLHRLLALSSTPALSALPPTENRKEVEKRGKRHRDKRERSEELGGAGN
jgi:hypothetical protein